MMVAQKSQASTQQMETRRSKKMQMKKLTANKIPEDVGLLPLTFIRPPNREMPRLFGATWRQRLKLELCWMRTRIQNFGSLFYFVYWPQRKLPKSQKLPLDLQSRPFIALALHKLFYTHLASGNIQPLRDILLPGLADKTGSQIAHRTANNAPSQSWKIIRYTSPIRLPFYFRFFPWPLTSLVPGSQAKIVSDRIIPIPRVGQSKDILIRQCIVKIRSLQSLDKNDGSPPIEANVTEYIVMQQLKKEKEEQVRWKIWGTTMPTTGPEMEAMINSGGSGSAKQHNITMLDRFKASLPFRGP